MHSSTFWLVIPFAVFLSCSGGNNGGGSGDGGTFQEVNCTLVNDSFGPGQYSSSCVRREWVASYVGVYNGGSCKLTITTPPEGPAAVFKLELTHATLGGT